MPRTTPRNRILKNVTALSEAKHLLDEKNSCEHIPMSNDKIANALWEDLAIWLEDHRALSTTERRAELLTGLARLQLPVDIILDLAASTLLKYDDIWKVLDQVNSLGIFTAMGHKMQKANTKNASTPRKSPEEKHIMLIKEFMKGIKAYHISFKDFLKYAVKGEYGSEEFYITKCDNDYYKVQAPDRQNDSDCVIRKYDTLKDWYSRPDRKK